MKIVILTQYYSPEPVAVMPEGIAEELVRRGHEVSVITSFPNYPEGEIYPGYRQRLRLREEIRGIPVTRVPMFIYRGQNSLGRMINYFSFALSAATEMRDVRDADVVYVYATQMTPGIAAAWWKLTLRKPFVLHVQDLWPESITGSSMVKQGIATKAITTLLNPWLKRMYKKASATVAIAPTMKAKLIERGVREDQAYTVLNWHRESVEVSINGQSSDLIKRFRNADSENRAFVYAGNLGEMQDLDTVIDAAKLLKTDPRFHLFIVGAGVKGEVLEQRVKVEEISNVTFLGRISAEEMKGVYQCSDYQLVTLKDLEIFRGTVPSKLQGSLFEGVPVVTNVGGDVADIVKAHDVGFVANPESAESLAEAFRAALQTTEGELTRMAQRAKLAYSEMMSLDKGVDTFEQIFSDIIDQIDRR